jgi:hypothetical protein
MQTTGEVVADADEAGPERTDRAQQVDPGAEHPPVATTENLDGSGHAGGDHVQPS